jgi:hypothetical protein
MGVRVTSAGTKRQERSLIDPVSIFAVIPAKAGIHRLGPVIMDAGFRRHDKLGHDDIDGTIVVPPD